MLEKLPISDRMRTEIYKEIGTEELIRWAGQPMGIYFIENNIKYILGGIVSIIGSLFLVYCLFLIFDLFFRNIQDIFLVIIGIFVVIILLAMIPVLFFCGFLLLSFAIKNWKKREIVYLITNQRAIRIWRGIMYFSARSRLPSQLKDISLRERKDGSGDIVFGHDSWDDGYGYTFYTEWGFMKILNVREVEKMLRHLAQNGNDDTYN
ncbi:MAG: hypothetical protein AAGG00_20035 [Cyanobacteria bacterium P01_H01_bin.150]